MFHQRTARLAKEVIEVKRHLKRRRDRELSDLVEPTVEATFDVVAKGIIRGAAVAAAQVAVQEVGIGTALCGLDTNPSCFGSSS